MDECGGSFSSDLGNLFPNNETGHRQDFLQTSWPDEKNAQNNSKKLVDYDKELSSGCYVEGFFLPTTHPKLHVPLDV